LIVDSPFFFFFKGKEGSFPMKDEFFAEKNWLLYPLNYLAYELGEGLNPIPVADAPGELIFIVFLLELNALELMYC